MKRREKGLDTPDYVAFNAAIGGEVRYYEESDGWRYVHAKGEGRGLKTLEAAEAEVKEWSKTKEEMASEKNMTHP